jgi:hypothetical protein
MIFAALKIPFSIGSHVANPRLASTASSSVKIDQIATEVTKITAISALLSRKASLLLRCGASSTKPSPAIRLSPPDRQYALSTRRPMRSRTCGRKRRMTLLRFNWHTIEIVIIEDTSALSRPSVPTE